MATWKERIFEFLDANPELEKRGSGYLYQFFDCGDSTVRNCVAEWRKLRGRPPRNYRAEVFKVLNEQPELAEEIAVLKEMFDCADSTVEHHVWLWRKTHTTKFVLPASVKSTSCESCKHFDYCRRLDALGLPMLCEGIPEDLQVMYQNLDVWGDVLRSRVEVGT